MWIPASYKSDRYAKWKERSKLANVSQDDGGGGDGGGSDGEQTPGKKRESLIHTCSLFVSERLGIIY